MRIFGALMIGLAALFPCGCGAAITAEFPNRLIGADGQEVILDDIETIINEPNLTDEERRLQLRELGIEDEALIEALLAP